MTLKAAGERKSLLKTCLEHTWKDPTLQDWAWRLMFIKIFCTKPESMSTCGQPLFLCTVLRLWGYVLPYIALPLGEGHSSEAQHDSLDFSIWHCTNSFENVNSLGRLQARNKKKSYFRVHKEIVHLLWWKNIKTLPGTKNASHANTDQGSRKIESRGVLELQPTHLERCYFNLAGDLLD